MAEGNDSQMQQNCKSCTKPDNHDNMVACDLCGYWHHYSCVLFDPRNKDMEWYCSNCELQAKQTTERITGNDFSTQRELLVSVDNNNNAESFPLKVASQSESNAGSKGAKTKTQSQQVASLTLPAKKQTKSVAGSRSTRRSKKTIGDASVATSGASRLELQLKVIDEQRRIQEEELAVEKEINDLQLKKDRELRDMEAAIEARIEMKKLADMKVLVQKQMADEVEYRRKQMAVRKQSAEEKAKLIRQASEYTVSSAGDSAANSREKVANWLAKSDQQIEGEKASTSAVDPLKVVPPQVPANAQVMYNKTKKTNEAVEHLQPPSVINKDMFSKPPSIRGDKTPLPVSLLVPNVCKQIVNETNDKFVRKDTNCNNSIMSTVNCSKPTKANQKYIVYQSKNDSNCIREAGSDSEQVPKPNSANKVMQLPNSQTVFCDIMGRQYGADREKVVVADGWPANANGGGQQSIHNNRIPEPRRNYAEDDIGGPTSRQLAARQVMGKDLPVFAGDPEEWPIWISNFERSTSTCGFSMDENLIRLQRSLRGAALETVRSRLLCPSSVPHVIRTLEMRYGRPEVLIRTMTERIRQLPPPKINDLDSLIEFGLVVDNLVEHLRNAGQQTHLSNPSLLHDLVSKLPTDYKLKWSAYKSTQQTVDLGTFGVFMTTLVELAYDVVDDTPTLKQSRIPRQRNKERAFVQAHSQTASSKNEVNSKTFNQRKPKRPCAVCKSDEHRVADCICFKSMSIDERFRSVNQHGLCRSCLNQHGKWPCKSAKECGINDCRLKHHNLLHSSSTVVHAAISSSHLKDPASFSGLLFRILPVTLYGKDRQLNIYAFVDEGSQITLLEDAVAEQLGIHGKAEALNLQWTGNIKRSEPNSRRISADISGSGILKRFRLSDARTVGNLVLPSQSMNYQDLSRVYPHLRGLPLQSYENVSPKLLIGLDNLKLTVPVKIREGGWKQPMAAKCRIGWSIYGSSIASSSTAVSGFHVGTWGNPEQELNQLVREYITLDNIGVMQPLYPLESEEDKRARRLLETTTQRVEGGFETGLLWRWDRIRFPDSYGMAFKRLRSLEKRLTKDPNLYDRVRQLVREYEIKGYAHKATQKELSTTDPEHCWYLPLGIVLNPKKPNKLRMIWDAAATVSGVSLNSALLKGPDFLTSLPTVISKFRLYRFALTGDIKEMFHRFFIRKQDRQYQRFLFRESPDQHPIVYVMDVAIFGATCSPSSAQFIKNLNASEFEVQYPRAAAAIIHHHYVDDYLDSFGTKAEAVKIGSEVKELHAKGGFEIRNFLSNDPEISRQIGAEVITADKDIRVRKGEQIESVLGMKWIPCSDCFTYTVCLAENLTHVLKSDYTPTKREVLRTVMSFFDPLGLMAFFLIHGRTLMQDIWASGTGWDDSIEQKLCLQWRNWIELLPKISSLRIPRCYFRDAIAETYSTLQVHVFVDASRSAYACALYFRIERSKEPEVILVASKSKVAPLKMLTVPRLELQAAVLGSRQLHSVISMHKLNATKRVLWTDSATVLAWIRSDQRRYHQFVGFRISEILSTTDVSEWRKVPTKANVADDATKWGAGPNINSDSRWFRGPDFLRLPEELWPSDVFSVSTDEELIPYATHHSAQFPLIDVSRFSRWERLHRTVAYVHRFFDNFLKRKSGEAAETGPLNRDELKKAETTLWRQAQHEYFLPEITVLEKTKGDPEQRHAAISKASTIFKLWPFMDSNGVIRKRSRLANADWMSYTTKYPIILPRNHRISFLITELYHRKFRHLNRETVVNEMRQLYEIPKLRSLVAYVAKSCMWCKVYCAQPRAPPMAPLPKVRLTPYVRPFTYVGLDYFGPVFVKVGRSNAKRWVALFTCLTIRAIHLEVVHSLSTESCIMAVRRFVARRGAPSEIFSDNATNFHGANNQLIRDIQEHNTRLATIFTNSVTRWSFIPPGAPHMGGAWERMVRSVKAALGTILDTQRKPDDEVLKTVIIEAEAMVNTRPLTYVPLESADNESLTPNHFLLGSSSGVKPLPSAPVDYRATLQSGWKLAQHLSDGIWRRWTKEYLPVITRRSKWFEEVKDLEVGDLVVVVDGSIRNQWIRGKVDKVVRGKDGRVRQAWVQTSKGVMRRPAVKLALLDVLGGSKPEVDHKGLRAGECDDEKPSQ